jgi:hypothetical protein
VEAMDEGTPTDANSERVRHRRESRLVSKDLKEKRSSQKAFSPEEELAPAASISSFVIANLPGE